MKKYIVYFEDHGQDFLKWTVCSETGIIEDCQPFQGSVWVGKKVIANGNMVIGGTLSIQYVPSNLEIKYPIMDIKEIDEPTCYYLSFIGHTYVLNNSLEKAFYEMLKGENRKLIQSHEIKSFQNKILESTEVLNKNFPRCKPLKIDWIQSSSFSSNQAGKHPDYYLSIGASICMFHLYASKVGELRS